jgi:hypothetical protein
MVVHLLKNATGIIGSKKFNFFFITSGTSIKIQWYWNYINGYAWSLCCQKKYMGTFYIKGYESILIRYIIKW